jgi:hypothetical protein
MNETKPSMNFTKTLTSLGLAALAAFAPIEAMARGRSTNFDDHVRLAQEAVKTGIDFKINPPACDERDAFGWYFPGKNELVVCQENRIKGSTKEVAWTEEDLDTLRHEVHHMVQDCMIGGNRDGSLDSVYFQPVRFGLETLGEDRVRRIVNVYARQGANKHIQIMEIEAFSVAAMNEPLEQIADIQRFCGQ